MSTIDPGTIHPGTIHPGTIDPGTIEVDNADPALIDPDTRVRPAPATLDRQVVRGASSAVMAMVLLVASESVFFAAFLGIYASAFTQAPVWPPQDVPTPDLILPSVAMAVLLVSLITMRVAVRQVRPGGPARRVRPWLAVTLACAIAFVALVIAGFPGLGYGIGQGIYESLFYVITALALAHVAGGIILFVLILLRTPDGHQHLIREPMKAAGIYWYFVVALGLVIYLLLYVMVAA